MQTVIDQDGKANLYPHFYKHSRADELFDLLSSELNWQNESIRMYGKLIPVPRMVCWYGDKNAVYAYSGVSHIPETWTEGLLQIRQDLEKTAGTLFNSVLGNLYRHERDSMGWHSDNEKELGLNPTIASISLGAPRKFKLRHNKSKKIVSLELPHGSLLLMSGELQHHWQHSLPKCRESIAPRINLTFRNIVGYK